MFEENSPKPPQNKTDVPTEGTTPDQINDTPMSPPPSVDTSPSTLLESGVDDIFEKSEPILPQSPSERLSDIPLSVESRGALSRNAIIAIVVILILILAIVGIALFSSGNEKQPVKNTNASVNTNQQAQIPVETTQDSDFDGLSDSEEARIGTNTQQSDTDNDGLNDYEEVRVWKTDPLNPDTDGDTFKDGDEVRGGYNPNGEGKITDVNNVSN